MSGQGLLVFIVRTGTVDRRALIAVAAFDVRPVTEGRASREGRVRSLRRQSAGVAVRLIDAANRFADIVAQSDQSVAASRWLSLAAVTQATAGVL